MKKVIQHPNETIYELVCSTEDLAFWVSFGFKPYLYDKSNESYGIRKNCPFRIHKKVGNLSIVSNGKKKGLADRWGNIILDCQYERIELCSSSETHGIQVIHIMTFISQRVNIFRYTGGKPKRVLSLERLQDDI